MCRGKQYLTIEEVVYVPGTFSTCLCTFLVVLQLAQEFRCVCTCRFLVDRGSMLLVCDSEDGDERELSRQECYSLLVCSHLQARLPCVPTKPSSHVAGTRHIPSNALPHILNHVLQTQLGVSPATFQVYSHLMRDGVTVRRFPPVWQQNTGTLAGLHAPWSTYWPDSATTVAKDLARSDPRPGPPRGSVSAPCEAAAPTDESPPEAPTAGGAAGSLPEQRPALPAAGAASVPPERLGLARDQEAGVQGHAAPSALAGAVEHDTGALRQTGAAACDPSSTLAANATDLDPGAGDMDAAGVSTSGAAPANTAMYHVRFAAMSDEAVFSRRQPPYVQYVVAVMNDTSECAPSWVDCATCEAAVHGSEHANADVLYAIADSGDVHFTQCPPGGVPDLLM